MPYEFPCIIANQIKKQKKTSRCKLINWIYKKLFGYEYESTLPEGCSVMLLGDKLVFRDKETYERVRDSILENNETEIL